jgi:hypothetical protein
MTQSWIEQARQLMRWPVESVERGKKRFEDLFSNQGSDYLPLVLAVPVPELSAMPRFNYRESFFDPEKMAISQAADALARARSGSDAQPTIRPNTGVGTVISVFGLSQEILPDAMPWPKEHLSKEQIADLEPIEDVSNVELMVHIKKIVEFYQTHLPEFPITVFDTQGPFDIAHLVRGDQIFYDFHDDVGFLRHLMELSTNAYIRAAEYAKKLIGEVPNQAYHTGMFLSAAGVRVCEDTSVLIGPRELEQFVLPYTHRVMDYFGGGYVHYCGRNDHLLDMIIEQMPACRYLNLGNPDLHDIVDVIRRLSRAGKVYCGGIHRQKGETLEAYFRRLLSALDGKRFGLILVAKLTPEESAEPQSVIDLYHRLQDELLS